MQQVDLTARSIEELEQKKAQLQEQADASGVSFQVRQQFKVGKNAPCVCGSGKKWKQCCMGLDETTIVIRPAGQHPPDPLRKRKRGVGALAMFGMAIGLLCED